MLRYIVAAAVAVACAAPVLGAEKEEHREHGAHEHGSAEMNLAWEGKTVTIEFESPAVNLVGFEHAPRTDAQKKAVKNALTTLKNTSRLFGFTPDARCSGQATEVESELAGEEHSAHEKGHGKEGEEEHSEFRAQYRYTCEKPEALKSVDVHLFKVFPKTHKIRAQIVSARGQTATELKPGRARLTLP